MLNTLELFKSGLSTYWEISMKAYNECWSFILDTPEGMVFMIGSILISLTFGLVVFVVLNKLGFFA